MAEYTKPLPKQADPELTDPFWEAAKRHELVIPRCHYCNNFFWYPRPACRYCMQENWEWTPVSGKARLYTFTIVRQPQFNAFADDTPYVYGVVQLNEGVRLISNVIGCAIPEDISVDMPLEVAFDDISPDWTLVKFRPA